MPEAVYVVSAIRTPIGAYLGALASVPAPRLGATAIKSALERAGVAADQVDEVFMGNVLSAGIGQAPARQAASDPRTRGTRTRLRNAAEGQSGAQTERQPRFRATRELHDAAYSQSRPGQIRHVSRYPLPAARCPLPAARSA